MDNPVSYMDVFFTPHLGWNLANLKDNPKSRSEEERILNDEFQLIRLEN